MKQKDIKLLWGRSGNRCAICRIILTQDEKTVDASHTLGEQAHIVGEKEDSPRGKSPLTSDERDGYHNRILLCPNHHTEIDTLITDWPIERLHLVKSEHELWVLETLSDSSDVFKKAEEVAVSSIIDKAVRLCHLTEWTQWTSSALDPIPMWRENYHYDIYRFRQHTIAAIWPDKFKDLMRATQTFSILLHAASEKFMEHSKSRGGDWIADQWYKGPDWNDKYHEDLKNFKAWLKVCYDLIYRSTQAANWFADVVRRDINPMFFAEEGKYLIHHGPFEDLTYLTDLLEFTDDQKASYPEGLENV